MVKDFLVESAQKGDKKESKKKKKAPKMPPLFFLFLNVFSTILTNPKHTYFKGQFKLLL